MLAAYCDLGPQRGAVFERHAMEPGALFWLERPLLRPAILPATMS